MNRVLEHIERKKLELARLPLFTFTQDRDIEPQQRLGFAPCLAPMTMGFADLMKFGLRDESSGDWLQQRLNAHTSVDDRHWELFMRDLETLGLNEILSINGALKQLWGEHSAKTRQLIYRLMALVHGTSPILRLVILEMVEATTDVAFSQFRQVGREFTEKTGKALSYFGEPHQHKEDEHEAMKENSIRALISSHAWAPEEEACALELVDEVSASFAEMGAELLAYAQKARETGPLWPLVPVAAGAR